MQDCSQQGSTSIQALPLTPDDFRADLSEDDLRKLRQEVRAEQIRRKRTIELTVRKEADPQLVPGDLVWIEVPREGIAGRFLVVSAEATHEATRYKLVGQRDSRRRVGEPVIRIES